MTFVGDKGIAIELCSGTTNEVGLDKVWKFQEDAIKCNCCSWVFKVYVESEATLFKWLLLWSWECIQQIHI